MTDARLGGLPERPRPRRAADRGRAADARRRGRALRQRSRADRRRLARARRARRARGSSTCAGRRSSQRTRRATSTSRSSTSRCSARPIDAEYVAELDAHLAVVDDVADHYAWSYVDFLERYRDRFGRAFAAVADADGAGRRALHGRQGPHRARRRRCSCGSPASTARRSAPTTRSRRRTSRPRPSEWIDEAADDARAGEAARSSRDTPAEGDGARRSRRSSAATATSRRTCAQPGSATPRSSGCGSALSLLELRDVEARYGEIRALHGVSLSVDDGDFVAILGANGAGKTTTLRAISGTVKTSGDVLFEGEQGLPPHAGGDGAARRRARARGPRHVHDALGARQPAARRVGAARHVAARPRARLRVLPAPLRAPRPAGRARSPAASSRCSRSAAR